ncbi:hypothetical protein EWI61_11260 [Methylolobus aquaticus]|nr:hypothetical protein EWI61_11260 [Methylolobus aquaticus]
MAPCLKLSKSINYQIRLVNRLRRSAKWVSLSLLLAMIGHFTFDHSEASAFVLCFGADGHVAVERADHDHRPFTPRSLEKRVASETALPNADRPCVDVPVASDDHGPHTPFPEFGERWSDMDWVALIALCFILLPPTRTASSAFRVYAPPLFDSRTLLRRSIVLLI